MHASKSHAICASRRGIARVTDLIARRTGGTCWSSESGHTSRADKHNRSNNGVLDRFGGSERSIEHMYGQPGCWQCHNMSYGMNTYLRFQTTTTYQTGGTPSHPSPIRTTYFVASPRRQRLGPRVPRGHELQDRSGRHESGRLVCETRQEEPRVEVRVRDSVAIFTYTTWTGRRFQPGGDM